MAKDLSKTRWHGIPRTEIPWFPEINEEKCIGCELCYVSCGREVFEYDDETRKAAVERPYNCMVGCTTCAMICPTGAIMFPPREMIQKIEKEYRILKIVRETARKKKTKKALEEARAKAEEILNTINTTIEIEATGHFGERKIIPKIFEAIKDEPCDLLYINIETPSLKSCWNEKAPSYARFRIVSAEYSDITSDVEIIKNIFRENDIVLISEKKIA